MKLPNLFAVRITLLVIAAPLSWLAVPAAAQGGADAVVPITIDHCTIADQAALDNPRIGMRTSSVAGLTIVYTNDRDVAASEVDFRVRYQGRTLKFVDRRSIPAHAKISREFSNFNAVFYGNSADCSVTSAAFADGTRWDGSGQAQTPAPSR